MLKSTELMLAVLSAALKIRRLPFLNGLRRRYQRTLRNCSKCLDQANLLRGL